VLAAELESRLVPDDDRKAEALVRKERHEAEAREVERVAEERRRRAAEAAAKLAPGRFRMAVLLERAGRIDGAVEFYRQIVRDSPNTKEGRSSAERIASLLPLQQSP
jgi:predicted TPR repeat methyltransferase